MAKLELKNGYFFLCGKEAETCFRAEIEIRNYKLAEETANKILDKIKEISYFIRDLEKDPSVQFNFHGYVIVEKNSIYAYGQDTIAEGNCEKFYIMDI